MIQLRGSYDGNVLMATVTDVLANSGNLAIANFGWLRSAKISRVYASIIIRRVGRN